VTHKLFEVLGLCLVGVCVVGARPVRTVRVPDLAERADVIVLGRITATRQAGVETVDIGSSKSLAQVIVAQLEIRHVVKGAPDAPSITLRYVLPSQFSGYLTPPTGRDAIFFLRGAGREFELADPYRPSVPGALAPEPSGDAMIDRLTSSIIAALDSGAASPGEKREAIWALGTIPGDRAARGLRNAAPDADPYIGLNAIASLLMRNDISVLQSATDALLQSGGVPPSEVRQNLLSSISNDVSDPRAVATLATLLKRGDASARAAAVSALARTASAGAIDPLTDALSDSDRDVRYRAAIGLSDLTGISGHRPGLTEFRARESEYLDYWRDWARRR
jgi:hypothetical protein